MGWYDNASLVDLVVVSVRSPTRIVDDRSCIGKLLRLLSWGSNMTTSKSLVIQNVEVSRRFYCYIFGFESGHRGDEYEHFLHSPPRPIL